jgi:hypothetical protein
MKSSFTHISYCSMRRNSTHIFFVFNVLMTEPRQGKFCQSGFSSAEFDTNDNERIRGFCLPRNKRRAVTLQFILHIN